MEAIKKLQEDERSKYATHPQAGEESLSPARHACEGAGVLWAFVALCAVT